MSSTSAKETSVDYTTEYLYLDVREEVDWSGNLSALRRKEYRNMLYTLDGVVISKLPIKRQNWPSSLRKEYQDVQQAENESKDEVLMPRGAQPSMRQTPTPGMSPRGMPPMGGYGGYGEGPRLE